MSDAMTNREIEDVLTSIRRLVAQEGGRNGETGRLILTEAQRIVCEAAPLGSAGAKDGEGDTFGIDDDTGFPAPLDLSDPVARDDARDDGHPEKGDDHGLPAPDFGQLEATIAELEAAVAGGVELEDDDEVASSVPQSDGMEAADARPAAQVSAQETSNVTALYGRLSFQHRRQGGVSAATAGAGSGADLGASEPADTAAAETAAAPSGSVPIEGPETARGSMPHSALADAAAQHTDLPVADAFEDRYALPPEPVAAAHHTAPAPDLPTGKTASVEHGTRDDPVQDDLEPEETVPVDFGPSAVEDTVIDEAMLRALVSQLVREELHGQLGERITLQVRKLVRAEIAKALDERNFL